MAMALHVQAQTEPRWDELDLNLTVESDSRSGGRLPEIPGWRKLHLVAQTDIPFQEDNVLLCSVPLFGLLTRVPLWDKIGICQPANRVNQ